MGVGAALALYTARTAVDMGVAAARSGQVACGAQRAADGAGRVAARAAQRAAETPAQTPAAPEKLRRGGGRECHSVRGERGGGEGGESGASSLPIRSDLGWG